MASCTSSEQANEDDDEAEAWSMLLSLCRRAEQHQKMGDFRSAASQFLCVLDIAPTMVDVIREKLTDVLKQCNDGLMQDVTASEISQLLRDYNRALTYYPRSEQLLNDIGSVYFRLNKMDFAKMYFQSALSISPQYLAARENLDNLCSQLVDRWHFRMLNDTQRNLSYQQALMRAVCMVSAPFSSETSDSKITGTIIDSSTESNSAADNLRERKDELFVSNNEVETYSNSSSRDASHEHMENSHINVLDIGTGTGILSMYAAGAGNDVRVTACEMCSTMFNIAREIISTNCLTDRIQLVNKRSDELDVMNAKFKICVTETFDAGLFGEGVIGALDHAWNNFLQPQCKVIPEGATIYISAVECNALRQANRFLFENDIHLNMPGIHLLSTTGNTNKILHIHSPDVVGDDKNKSCDYEQFEPYTSEFINNLPGGYRLLSYPHAALTVQFDNPQDVKRYADGLTKSLDLNITSSGRLDALIVWFDLKLDSVTALTTSPVHEEMPDGDIIDGCRANSAAAVCWEQAIYPVVANHTQDVFVKSCDTLLVEMTVDDALRCSAKKLICQHESIDTSLALPSLYDKAAVVCHDMIRRGGDVITESTDICDMIKNVTDVVTKASDICDMMGYNSTEDFFYFDRTIITTLNDLTWNRRCIEAIEVITAKKASDNKLQHRSDVEGQLKDKDGSQTNGRLFKILDLTPHFTLLPLHCLALNLTNEVHLPVELDQISLELYAKLLATNCIEPKRLRMGAKSLVDYNLIFVDVVEPSGRLRQHILEDIALARSTSLADGGVIMPAKIAVYAKLIHSTSLLEASRLVDDSRTDLCNIAQFINEFQTTTHQDIELETLDYVALSEKMHLFTLDFNLAPTRQASSKDNTTCNNTVVVNSSDEHVLNLQCSAFDENNQNLPQFLKSENTVHVWALESQSLTALVYWFELELTDDIKISTLSQSDNKAKTRIAKKKCNTWKSLIAEKECESIDSHHCETVRGANNDAMIGSHWKQAAILLPQAQSLTVVKGDGITVKAFCNNSHIGVIVSKP